MLNKKKSWYFLYFYEIILYIGINFKQGTGAIENINWLNF